jgi:hypothetical protein
MKHDYRIMVAVLADAVFCGSRDGVPYEIYGG